MSEQMDHGFLGERAAFSWTYLAKLQAGSAIAMQILSQAKATQLEYHDRMGEARTLVLEARLLADARAAQPLRQRILELKEQLPAPGQCRLLAKVLQRWTEWASGDLAADETGDVFWGRIGRRPPTNCLFQPFAAHDAGNRLPFGFKALAVQPFPHVVLVVKLGQVLEQGLAGEGVAADAVQFPVQGSRHGAAEGFGQDVDLGLHVLVARRPELNPQFPQDVSLAVRQGKRVLPLRLPVLDLLGKHPLDPPSLWRCSPRQWAGP